MRSLSYLAVNCICGFFLAETAIAESIPVFNASFEDPTTDLSGTLNLPGWTRSNMSGDVGVWRPDSFAFSSIPDGRQVAFVKVGGFFPSFRKTRVDRVSFR